MNTQKGSLNQAKSWDAK